MKEITLDGQLLTEAKVPGDLSGKHEVEIVLDEQKIEVKPFSLVPNYFTPDTPQVEVVEGRLQWQAVDMAVNYQVWRNGIKIAETWETSYTPEDEPTYAEYQVAAVDRRGYASFLSQPILFTENTSVYLFEVENFVQKFSSNSEGYHGKGYVQITKEKNTELQLPLKVEEAGTYLLDFRYSNGNGPVHTDNKAAVRSLLKGDEYIGALVFPQRGEGEWSNWGWSNAVEVTLDKGLNQLCLALKSCSENMNKEENSAMLDQLRLIKFK